MVGEPVFNLQFHDGLYVTKLFMYLIKVIYLATERGWSSCHSIELCFAEVQQGLISHGTKQAKCSHRQLRQHNLMSPCSHCC